MRRPRFEIRTADDGKPYWVLVAPNGETLCTSETFTSRQACEKGIRAARRAALTATTRSAR